MTEQICILNTATSLIDVVTAVDTYTADQNAGSPILLNSSGQLDSSFLTSITTPSVTAFAETDLAAGDLVNFHYKGSGGSGAGIYARLADASANYPAHAYVSVDATMGTTISAYTQGMVNSPFTSGFAFSDVGVPLYLSPTTPGQVTQTRPSPPNLVQPLGYTYSVSSTVNFIFTPTPIPENVAPTAVALPISAPGNFTVAHGLSTVPTAVTFELITGGQVWFQNPRYDATNLYLTASDYYVAGFAMVWS